MIILHSYATSILVINPVEANNKWQITTLNNFTPGLFWIIVGFEKKEQLFVKKFAFMWDVLNL